MPARRAACGDEPERVQIIAMDTVMTFQTYGKAAEDALVDASAEVRRLDALLSRTDPESAVSRVNSAGGAPVEAGAERWEEGLVAKNKYAKPTMVERTEYPAGQVVTGGSLTAVTKPISLVRIDFTVG